MFRFIRSLFVGRFRKVRKFGPKHGRPFKLPLREDYDGKIHTIFGEYDEHELEKMGYAFVGSPVYLDYNMHSVSARRLERKIKDKNNGLDFDACVLYKVIYQEADLRHDSVLEYMELEVHPLKKE
jgi:hypothetical protein